jgi:hypothetical protein
MVRPCRSRHRGASDRGDHAAGVIEKGQRAMPTSNDVDYPYLRAWGQSIGSSSAFIGERLAQARTDHAPRDVIFHRDEPADDGRPEYLAPSGRRWRRYDHWTMPPLTRVHMAACLSRYGVDPAVEADPTPQWHWLEVPEVAWHGWVLYRTGDVLGRVARIVHDSPGRRSVLWVPFAANGVLLSQARPTPGRARHTVEAVHSLGTGDAVTRVCHRRLPGGAATQDDELPPAA